MAALTMWGGVGRGSALSSPKGTRKTPPLIYLFLQVPPPSAACQVLLGMALVRGRKWTEQGLLS